MIILINVVIINLNIINFKLINDNVKINNIIDSNRKINENNFLKFVIIVENVFAK